MRRFFDHTSVAAQKNPGLKDMFEKSRSQRSEIWAFLWDFPRWFRLLWSILEWQKFEGG